MAEPKDGKAGAVMAAARIRVFVMDVDGTMTDGKIYMGPSGECMKAFDIKDGYGIHEILPGYGVAPVIMTGRFSEIVTNRAKELGVGRVFQNVRNKKDMLCRLREQAGCRLDEIAFIGDDLMDLAAMKACGIAACPRDAVPEVKKVCRYVCSRKGGHGAVREFIDWLAENQYIGEM